MIVKHRAVLNRAISLLLCLGILLSGLLFYVPEKVQAAGFPDEVRQMRMWYTSAAEDSYVGWRNDGLPIGNGYMGAVILGRTDTERVQITENSLGNGYNGGGLNNFAELYFDFGHENVTNYERDIVLNDAISHVKYDAGSVSYEREYFASYPDKVLVMRFSASESGKLNFTFRPTIPYTERNDEYAKTGTVTIDGNAVTLEGNLAFYDIDYEGQIRVFQEGGALTSTSDNITVSNADTATIIMAVGTNYQLDPQVFLENDPKQKLAGFAHPHEKVVGYIEAACEKSFDDLKANHLADYHELYGRVDFDLGEEIPNIPTNQLLANYKANNYSRYFEMLQFQYGRYLLIASSREGGLPANLQGIWNMKEKADWGAGYWHNVNHQMNYSIAFNTNLAEMYKSYEDYWQAYYEKASLVASDYLYRLGRIDAGQRDADNNGWIIANGMFPQYVAEPSVGITHTYTGAAGYAAMQFWDNYDYTRDEDVLNRFTAPAIENLALFYSKQLIEQDGNLLIYPSSSPEQRNPNNDNQYIVTAGSTFDQQAVYATYAALIEIAENTSYPVDESILETVRAQIQYLDAFPVGYSGQIKEFREENYYNDFGGGEANHRHVSQLISLHPGVDINDNTSAWQDAAKVTLNKRGDVGANGAGWCREQRAVMWARLGDGDRAYSVYQGHVKSRIFNNLWSWNAGNTPGENTPMQVDGSFGITATMAEMLLSSDGGYIAPLNALPSAWPDGSYQGLVARGNFTVSAAWSGGKADTIRIESGAGGECRLKYPMAANAALKDADGNKVDFTANGSDIITFNTTKGMVYELTAIPTYEETIAPTNLDSTGNGSQITLTWNASANAASYNVYRVVNSEPSYELMANVSDSTATLSLDGLAMDDLCIYKVTAVAADGRESGDGPRLIHGPAAEPTSAVSYISTDGTVMRIDVTGATSNYDFVLYKQNEGNINKLFSSTLNELYVSGFDKEDQYFVSAIDRSSGRESTLVAVKPGEIYVENVFLNKPITASRNHQGTYVIDNLVDGDLGSRWAPATGAGVYHVEIDLRGEYNLGTIGFYEFMDTFGTRSHDTTIQVYRDGEWHDTAIVGQSLNIRPDGHSGNSLYTEFDLNDVLGSKVRIYFLNTETNNSTRIATLWEITCTAAMLSNPADTNAAELFGMLTEAKGYNLAGSGYHESVLLAPPMLEKGFSLLEGVASEEEMAAFIAEFRPVLDSLREFMQRDYTANLLLGKPVSGTDSQTGYPISNLNDNDLESRYAPNRGGTVAMTFDLEVPTLLEAVQLVELADGTIPYPTRSHETTVRVQYKGEWTTVLERVSLNHDASKVIGNKNVTELLFDEPVLADALEITCLNTDSTESNPRTASFFEISATGTMQQGELPASKDDLRAKIAEAKAIEAAGYTAESYAALQNAITAAEEIEGKPEATQKQVDDATEALQAAIDALEENPQPVDKSALESLIATAEAIDGGGYTTESFAALQVAIDAAKVVRDNDGYTQVQVNAAVSTLQNAIDALQARVPDKSALETALEQARLIEPAVYTAESYSALQTAIGVAQAVCDDAGASQAELDEAERALRVAMAALVPVGVDKASLAALVQTAEAIGQGDYTTESYEALQQAISNAQAVLDEDDAAPKAIEAAYGTLQAAIAGLVEKPPQPVDKSALATLIATAEAIEADGYTVESYAVLQSAIDAAKEVRDNNGYTQEQVNAAATTLQNAINALEEDGGTNPQPANKAALQEAIARAEALKAEAYTQESYRVLQQAIVLAKRVVADENATQEQVDDALDRLNSAIMNLEPAGPQPNEFKVLEGGNATYPGSGDHVIRIDAAFETLSKVKVDGNTLTPGMEYSAAAGSTVITLKADYLATLSGGIHRIEIIFEDGTALTTLAISKVEKPGGSSGGSSGNQSDRDSTIAATGDDSGPIAYMILSLFAFTSIFILAIRLMKRHRVK